MLVVQAHLYTALMGIRASGPSQSNSSVSVLEAISDLDRSRFDWRMLEERNSQTDDVALVQPFDVARTYLQEKLT
jgi:hypothetical protein